MIIRNKTFTSVNCPKGLQIAYETNSIFRDAFWEFISIFRLLYVQAASPIKGDPLYTQRFFTITRGIRCSKILSIFTWVFFSYWLEKGRFPLGRFRTYQFLGAIIATVAFCFRRYVTPLCGSGWTYVSVFILSYAFFQTTYAINDLGYWGARNQLSYDESVRSRISSLALRFSGLGSYLIAGITPAISGADSERNRRILSIVLVSCYFLSQRFYSFIRKERYVSKEREEERRKNIQSPFSPFKILKEYPQITLALFSHVLLFVSSYLRTGNVSNYFYYEFGYGAFNSASHFSSALRNGARVNFIYSICYGCGVIISNFLFPIIHSYWSKKKRVLVAMPCCLFIGFFLFFYGRKAGAEISLFIAIFLYAFFNGDIFASNTLDIWNTADLYEDETGKERSGSIASLKSGAVLVANSLQTLFFYLILATCGLRGVNDKVGQMEKENRLNPIRDFEQKVNERILSTPNREAHLVGYRAWITIVPAILLVICGCITIFGLKADNEKYYSSVVGPRKEKQHEAIEEKLNEEK
ncbi:MAG: MFS transporter [Candidatus Enterosoma sp.]|nr:MFS transporter [Candidatus Enterosoma sp.]